MNWNLKTWKDEATAAAMLFEKFIFRSEESNFFSDGGYVLVACTLIMRYLCPVYSFRVLPEIISWVTVEATTQGQPAYSYRFIE